MKKTFYSHLVNTDSLTIEIHTLDLSDNEKAHLLHLIDSSLHHTILDAILSELNETEKTVFLTHLAKDDHDSLWKHLITNIDNIEEKIKQAALTLKAEIYKDIHETKQKHQ